MNATDPTGQSALYHDPQFQRDHLSPADQAAFAKGEAAAGALAGAVIPGAGVVEAIASGAGARGIAIAVALEAPGLKQIDKVADAAKGIKEIVVSASKSPQAAQHLTDAGATGVKLTVDRGGAAARRADAFSGTPTKPGLDRDEVPPAVFKEGGAGSSVRHIDPSDNRSAGAQIGNQIRDVPDGGCVRISVCD